MTGQSETLIDEPLRVGDVSEIPEDMAATLRVVAGPDTGRMIPIDDPITIVGRDETCHVVLDDPRVSTRHAMVYFAGGEFRVRDLDSTNGSLLNGSPLTEFAKQIIVETERVASVIRGLLAFASEAGKEPVASHVGELVESTVQTFSEAFARDQVTIDLDVRVNLPVITCYRPQIKHVMTNLISNAHDALNERYPSADANKRIRVSAKILPVSESTKAESAEVPDPQSQIRNPQSVIRITVEDHGTGIPAELSERIFEPFFTTKDRSVASGATGRKQRSRFSATPILPDQTQ